MSGRESITVGCVLYAMCGGCEWTGEHPNAPHSWADPSDVAHALKTGRADPSSQPCACPCAKRTPPVYSNSTSEPWDGDVAFTDDGWMVTRNKGLWWFNGLPERNQAKDLLRLVVRNHREFIGDAA